MKFLEMISKRCGITKSRYTREERPLFTVSDLSRLKKGEFIYIGRETFPYVCHMKPYYEFEQRGELFPISQIPMRVQKERKLFNLLQKISEHEMTRNMKVDNPFYDLDRNENSPLCANKKEDDKVIYFSFYNDALRFTALKEIPQNLELEIREAFCNVQFGDSEEER